MDNSVGKRIETLRKSKKISQEDLAEKVGGVKDDRLQMGKRHLRT